MMKNISNPLPLITNNLISANTITKIDEDVSSNKDTSIVNNKDNKGIYLATRDVKATSSRIGYKDNRFQAHKMITEEPWSLDDMVSRPCLIKILPWTTSQVPGTILAKLSVPGDLLTQSITQAPFRNFVFWRGEPQLNLQITATPLHQGMVVAFFVPLTDTAKIDADIAPNFSSFSVNQSVYLSANSNTSAIINIPFNHIQGYLDLTNPSSYNQVKSMGFIYVMVLNQLAAAAAASTSVSLSLFSKFNLNEFKVPRFLTPQGNMTSIVNNWKNVSGATMPISTKGDDIDASLAIPGLDKPTVTLTQGPFNPKPHNVMNYSTGLEFCDKLQIESSGQALTTTETFATDMDEMSFDFLKKKFSYLTTVKFDGSMSPGDIIQSWSISPFPNQTLIKVGDPVAVPLITYISYPFEFWRGGLTYKFQIVATSFQTGKLFFSINFNSLVPSSTLAAATSQYGTAFELNQGSNEFEFTIPYVSLTSFKKVPNSNKLDLESCLGVCSLQVLQPLVSPNNTPVTIDINVFVAGADDFEVHTIGFSNSLVPVCSYPPTLRAQSDYEPLMTNETDVNFSQNEVVLSPTQQVQPVENIQFGSYTRSLRDLLKKYQPVYVKQGEYNPSKVIDPSGSGFPIIINVADMLEKPGPAEGNTFNGLLTWGSALFRQYRGGFRFKVIFEAYTSIAEGARVVEVPFSVFWTPNTKLTQISEYQQYLNATRDVVSPLYNQPYSKYQDLIRLPLLVSNGPFRTAEVETPFTTNYHSLLIPGSNLSEVYLQGTCPISNSGTLIIQPNFLTGQVQTLVYFTIRVYASLSDETRFGTLYQVPKLSVNAIDGKPIPPDGYYA